MSWMREEPLPPGRLQSRKRVSREPARAADHVTVRLVSQVGDMTHRVMIDAGGHTPTGSNGPSDPPHVMQPSRLLALTSASSCFPCSLGGRVVLR